MKKFFSVVVVLVMICISLINNCFAAENIPTFSQYLADYNYNYNCYDFYVNSFNSPYRNYVETRKDSELYQGYLTAWRMTTFNLVDLMDNADKEVGFYETILFDVLYQGEKNDPISKTYEKLVAATGAKALKSISEYMEVDTKEFMSTRMDELSNEEKTLLAEVLEKSELFGEVFGVLETVEKTFKYAENVEQFIQKTAKTQVILQRVSKNAEMLRLIKQHSSSFFLDEAIDRLLLSYNKNLSEEEVVFHLASDMAITEAGKHVLDALWKDIIADLNLYGYAISAAQEAGKLLSNTLFSTEENIELYYYLTAMYEFEDALKGAMDDCRKKYTENPVNDNCSIFNEGYKMILQTHLLGLDAAVKIVNTEHKSGLVNTLIKNFDDEDYDEYIKSLENMKSNINLTIDYMSAIAFNEYAELYGDEAAKLGMNDVDLPCTSEENDNAMDFLNQVNIYMNDVSMKSTEDIVLTNDVTIYGNLNLEKMKLYLNGFKLKVLGDITSKNSVIDAGKGELTIGGDYLCTYSHLYLNSGKIIIGGSFIENIENGMSSYAIFKMDHDEGYALINGDFSVYSATTLGGKYSMTAGVLEVKGDFLVGKRNKVCCYGFQSSGTHKVVLSGDGNQEVYLNNEYKGLLSDQYSYFNVIEIRKTSGSVKFTSEIQANEIMGEEIVIDGDLTLVKTDVTLSFSKLSVGCMTFKNIDVKLNKSPEIRICGNITQVGRTFDVGERSFILEGNYTIISYDEDYQNSSGSFDVGKSTKIYGDVSGGTFGMSYNIENPFLLVTGDMMAQIIAGNGTFEAKGDVKDCCRDYKQGYEFRTILSGDGEQVVKGSFDILEITNNSGLIKYEGRIFVKKLVSDLYTNYDLNIGVSNIYASNIKANNLNMSNSYSPQQQTTIEAIGNLTVDAELELNNCTIIVGGNLIHPWGSIKMEGGNLFVKGDYLAEQGYLDLDEGLVHIGGDFLIKKGEEENNYADFGLVMNNDDGHIIVDGNFYVDVYTESRSELTAGVLDIKGNFTQRSTGTPSSFIPKGTHRVILSGNGEQKIDFEDPFSSCFNILEIKNDSGLVSFDTSIQISRLEGNVNSESDLYIVNSNLTIISPRIQVKNLTLLMSTVQFEGECEIEISEQLQIGLNIIEGYDMGGIINLNKAGITVGGDVLQNGGMLNTGEGEILIKGDYIAKHGIFSAGSGKCEIEGDFLIKNYFEHEYAQVIFAMQNENAHIVVHGNFYIDSSLSHEGYLTAGILELRGNFTQKSEIEQASFPASGAHKVILSGDGKQEIYFEDEGYSYFNIVENKNENGVVFLTAYKNLGIKSPLVIEKSEFNSEKDMITVKLSGYENISSDNSVVMVALYSNNVLIQLVKMSSADDAAIFDNITTADDYEIKVFCWEDTIHSKPLYGAIKSAVN